MLEPTIKAIEAVDECLGRVVDTILGKVGQPLLLQIMVILMKSLQWMVNQ